MTVFILLVTVLIIFSLIQNPKISYLMAFVAMFCILGFRALSVGTDIPNYEFMFENEDYRIEIGWQVLSNLVKYIDGNFRTLLYLTAIITLTPLFYFVKKTSLLPISSILLYVLLGFYFFPFNIMRQSISIVFFALAWYFFLEKKYWKLAVSCLIGCTFHYSMIIILPFFFLIKFFTSMSTHMRMILLITTLLIGPFVDVLVRQITTLVGGEYALYSEYGSEYDINYLNAFMMQAIKSMFFVICYVRYVDKNNLFMTLLFIGLLLSNLLGYTIGINRIGYYFMFFSIIFFANYIGEADTSKTRLVNMISILIYAITLFIYLILNQSEGVIPYDFM